MDNKPRRPWLAALLTLLFPTGLGHMYSGRLIRGILLFVIVQLLALASAASLTVTVPSFLFVLFLIFINITFYIFCIIDATNMAKIGIVEYQPRKYNKWFAYVSFIVISWALVQLILPAIIVTNFVQAFKIPTGAMEPTILIGDHLLVNKTIYRTIKPNRSEIVVFKYPKDPESASIKRLIGLPGETIEIKGRTVYINDIPLNETYIQHINPESIYEHYGPIYIPKKGDRIEKTDSNLKVNGEILIAELVQTYQEKDSPNDEPFTMRQDHYFTMGDNRDNSMDSRYWGAVPRDYLIGKPLFIYWSFETPPDQYLRTSISERIQRSVDVSINFFRYARWERMLQPVQ